MNDLVATGVAMGAVLVLTTVCTSRGTYVAPSEAGGDADGETAPAVRSAIPGGDRGGHELGGSEELALFQEITRAEEEAFSEALARFPFRNERTLPTAPTVGFDEASGKRIRLADLRFGELLEDIARAHGMTRGEVEALYRRGRAERWRSE